MESAESPSESNEERHIPIPSVESATIEIQMEPVIVESAESPTESNEQRPIPSVESIELQSEFATVIPLQTETVAGESTEELVVEKTLPMIAAPEVFVESPDSFEGTETQYKKLAAENPTVTPRRPWLKWFSKCLCWKNVS